MECDRFPLNATEGLFLEPDPDVGGLGVLISFIASGMITLVMSIFYYLFLFDPAEEGFPNPIDELVLGFQGRLHAWLRRKGYLSVHRKEQIKEGSRVAIMALSDMQILLGLCAVVAGFLNIRNTAALYWQMLVYVAWFSNITHQCALLLFTSYLRKHRWARAWRVGLMTILVILLLVAIVPTMWFDWSYDLSEDKRTHQDYTALASTSCFFSARFRDATQTEQLDGQNSAFVTALISILYLFLSHLIRVVRLYTAYSDHISKFWTGQWISRHLRRMDKRTRDRNRSLNSKAWFYRHECPAVGIHIAMRLMTFILVSTLSGLGGVIYGTMIGMYKLVRQKNLEVNMTAPRERNNTLSGFGQLLPTMLLVTPFIAVVQAYGQATTMESDEDREPRPITEDTGRSNPQVYPRGPITSLESENRYLRVMELLKEKDKYASWFSATVFGMLSGELYLLASVYTNYVAGSYELFPLDNMTLDAGTSSATILTAFCTTPIIAITHSAWTCKSGTAFYWSLNAVLAFIYGLNYILHDLRRAWWSEGDYVAWVILLLSVVLVLLLYFCAGVRWPNWTREGEREDGDEPTISLDAP